MEVLIIVLLTVAIGLLVWLLAWYGPRRRHWHTHTGSTDEPDRQAASDRSDEASRE